MEGSTSKCVCPLLLLAVCSSLSLYVYLSFYVSPASALLEFLVLSGAVGLNIPMLPFYKTYALISSFFHIKNVAYKLSSHFYLYDREEFKIFLHN